MKFLTAVLLLFLVACKQKQATSSQVADSLSVKEEAAIEDDMCRHLYDSIEAQADTTVWEDEIDLYKNLYAKTEIRVGKSNITYTQIAFNTGDKAWDKQLNAKINKMVVNDIREMDLDTIQLMDTNYNYRVDIIPQFVTNRWVTIEYYRGGYLGGATFYTYGSYKHFTKSANGKLKEVLQPEIFIYDKDSSVRNRYYDRILKGLDTEINIDTFFTMAGCLDTVYPRRVVGSYYTIMMKHFITKDWYKTFYLIPTKKGLKSKNDYGDYYPSFPSGYIADIIIPYKSLKGIVKEKYLTIWQNSN